ncbi:MAG: hypothetical protein J6Y69_06685 [Treponema sp.]|nr:hypothetical protein [Treponema sp.]
MSKHSFTILFIFISSVFNIILTFGLIILLIVLSSFILFKCLGFSPEGKLSLVAILVSFLAGLIGGMTIFTKLCAWAIDKFNLQDKLESQVLGRYLPRGKKAPTSTPDTPQTVMPDSVKIEEDEYEGSEE